MFEKETFAAIGLAFIGAAIGLGQMLLSDAKLTLRLVAGRAIVSGGIGLAAAGALVFLPALPFYAQVGVAAALASLGTSAIESLVKRIFGGG